MKIILLTLCLFTQLVCLGQELPNKLGPSDKIYGLSKFWHEVDENFVYLDQIGRKTWDSTYRAMIPQVEQTRNDYDYYMLLLRFCALLRDGHTGINAPGYIGSLFYGKMFGKYWFGLEDVGGRAIVNRILKSEAEELPIGTEVIAVNGLPTRQYAKQNMEPYISSSTGYVRERLAIENLLLGLIGASYDVTFKNPMARSFPCISRTPKPPIPLFTRLSLTIHCWNSSGTLAGSLTWRLIHLAIKKSIPCS